MSGKRVNNQHLCVTDTEIITQGFYVCLFTDMEIQKQNNIVIFFCHRSLTLWRLYRCSYVNQFHQPFPQLSSRFFWQHLAGYSDTSANEDNSFQNHIRQSKRDFLQVSIENRLIRSGCCPLFKDKLYKTAKKHTLKEQKLTKG